LVVVVALVAATVVPAGAADIEADVGVDAVPAIPCDVTPPDGNRALVPSEAITRSGLQPLWDAGFRGQGMRVAIIELGTAVDADPLAAYQQCLGQEPVPFFAHQVSQQDPPPPTPPPSGEAMLDSELVVALAPELDRLTEFYNADPNPSFEDTLRAALSPE